MAEAASPPLKKRPARNNHRRDVPTDLMEDILQYLPMKSLLRFSSASKSWNSIILGSSFANRYGGRRMIILKPGSDGHLRDALVRPLSSLSPKRNPLGGATLLVPPSGQRPYLVASCDELWCVQVKNTLILWNPSFPMFRKLPKPLLPPSSKHPPWSGHFRYGLGFDSVKDDYKMLKIFTYDNLPTGRSLVVTELYSLRSDSWRKIQPFPDGKIVSKFGLFVGGALHWLVRGSRGGYVVVSFNLLTEKYGITALPNVDRIANCDLEMRVLRGMLCVCVNYRDIAKFVIWVIEDYNQIPKTWTKEVEINYSDVPPGNEMRPFDSYDDDRNLVKAVISSTKKPEIFTYKKLGKESQVEVMNVAGDAFNGNVNIFNSLVYVEKPSVAGRIADFCLCRR